MTAGLVIAAMLVVLLTQPPGAAQAATEQPLPDAATLRRLRRLLNYLRGNRDARGP